MNKLNRLLPNTFPKAKSDSFTKITLLIVVTTSGREVTEAKIMVPIHKPPIPVVSAIKLPYLVTL
jgi:hypothetical protein